MKILITGATGHFGSLVVERLLEIMPASQLAVSVRNIEKANYLRDKGVEVRFGDFDKPESLHAAFKGIDRLLIISTNEGDRVAQHKAAIQAAKKAGISFIAYTSVSNAPKASGMLADHFKTEQYIQKSGIPYSILRNNWYVENESLSIESAVSGNPWLNPVGAAKIGWATRKDFALAAVVVLTQKGHDFKIYELSGPLRTTEELVQLVEKIAGKPIQLQNVTLEEYGEIMVSSGVPDALVSLLKSMEAAIGEGLFEVESNDLETLLERKLEPLEIAIQKILTE